MNFKEFIKDYLNFTRKERIAVIVIAVIITMILLVPEVLRFSKSTNPIYTDTSWIREVNQLEVKQADSLYRNYQAGNDDNSGNFQIDRTKSSNSNYPGTKFELFYFNPNTASPEEWKRLGLREKTINTIQNYLIKGGKFRKPEDLQRIYGLHPEEYDRLKPYIKIENTELSKPGYINNNFPKDINEPRLNTTRFPVIDINAADTTAFIALPGIGSKLASRIVNFRDKLGGFYSIEQVKETFGLPDSTFQKIKQYLKLDDPSVKKININTATVEELKAHPYIKYSLANPIVAYRNEHGLFSKLEDLKKVMAVTDEMYNKIAPYLFVQ